MNRYSRLAIADTDYGAVRRVMGSARTRLDDAALEDLLMDLFPDSDPGDVENFMRTLQRFGQQVAPIAQRALPGVLQGAAQGGMVAGPWGALAGAIGGGAASLLAGGGRAAPRPPRPPTPSRPQPASPPGTPVGAAPGTARAVAPAQLLALLSRPETMQALLALLMSSAGRPTVPVGGRPVPAAAFANAIAELAAEAVQSLDTPPDEGVSEYLLDDHGEPRADVANPAARAALLLADLGTVADEEAEDAGEHEWLAPEREPLGWSRPPALFGAEDPIDSYEAALEGRDRYDD